MVPETSRRAWTALIPESRTAVMNVSARSSTISAIR